MTSSQKHKIAWLLFALVLCVRVISMITVKYQQPMVVGAISVNGHFFLRPLIVDLLLPIMLLIVLHRYLVRCLRFTWLAALLALAEAALLIVVLIAPTAWLLQGQLQIAPGLPLPSGMRLAQYVLDFLALNLMLDLLAERPRWEQWLYAFLASFALIYAEDLLIAALCLWAATWYLRSVWREDPGRASLTALFLGIGIIAVKVTGYHHYYQMIWGARIFLVLAFVGFLALTLFAWLWRWRGQWGLGPKALSVAVWVIALGVLRITLLPSPDQSFQYVEQIGVVRLEYNDERAAGFGQEYARILDAAFSVTQKYYGVTPKVSAQVVLVGVGSGGFLFFSPSSIYMTYGRVPEKFLEPWSTPADVAIYDGPQYPFNPLHEFCHTFGSPGYLVWGEPINEGWASYCATRLMKLIYQDYGPAILRSPYDYGAYADTLALYPLENDQGLVHDHEYTAFRLWTDIADKIGERELFQRVVRVAPFDFTTFSAGPREAQRIAETFGPDLFAQHGFTVTAWRWWWDPLLSLLVVLAGAFIKIRLKGSVE